MALSEKRRQEINRRVDLTGDFLIKTHLSTREIAEHFSDNSDIYFKASHVSISDYVKKYMMKYPEKENLIKDILDENKGSSLNQERILKRINDAYAFLEQGLNFEEIAYKLNESYWVIYYDIHLRLRKLDNHRYNLAKEFIKNNQKNKNKK